MTAALFLTILTGVLGGLVFYKIKVPAGMLVGAIVSVSFLSVLTPYASMPADAKLCALFCKAPIIKLGQSVVGQRVGEGIGRNGHRDNIAQLAALLKKTEREGKERLPTTADAA